MALTAKTYLTIRRRNHAGFDHFYCAEVVRGRVRPACERDVIEEREPTDEELLAKYGGSGKARADWLRALGTQYDKIEYVARTEVIPESDDRAVWIVTDTFCQLLDRGFYEVVEI